ncbi:MAG: hypothetical protein R6V23_02445 [Bacteroidales bacterium]
MIKNKNFILPFLLLAWTTIFAHSIIPHHHHNSHHNFVYDHCPASHHQNTFAEELTDHNHDCTDHTCHFHVEVLRQVSIDHVFITSNDNNYTNYLIESKSGKIVFDKEIFSDQIPKTNYLRGPPLVA